MKKIYLFLITLFIGINLIAQINVSSSNNVGIGTTNPLSKLSVGADGNSSFTAYFFNSNTSSSYNLGLCGQGSPNNARAYGVEGFVTLNAAANANYGVYGSSASSTPLSNGKSYGVYGIAANATTGYNYAVYGQLTGSNNGAAIFGVVPGYSDVNTGGMYAGYFQGNVKVAVGILYTPTGTVTASDTRLKKNIFVIDSSENIFNLQPLKYNLKSINEQNQVKAQISGNSLKSDTSKVTNFPDPDYIKKNHFGFLAQDVQKIYPDLVYTCEDGTLGIDYQGFIPLIIAQLKTMKQSINLKDAKITALENRIAAIEKLLKK